MDVVTRYVTGTGRLPCKISAPDDRLAPKEGRGSWKFLKTKTVLAAAGIHTIARYVQVRRPRIMRWVEDRHVLKLCREAERRRRTTPRLYRWEQPMDLD